MPDLEACQPFNGATCADPADAFGLVPLERLRAHFRASASGSMQRLAESDERDLRQTLETLAGLKRVCERLCGDDEFRECFTADPMGAAVGIAVLNPEDAECLRQSLTLSPEVPIRRTHNLELYWDFLREANDWSEQSRQIPRTDGQPYSAWRQRRLAAQQFDFPPGVETWFRPAAALELTLGCSVGCWFCAVSAPKPGGIYSFDGQGAREFPQVLSELRHHLGPAAATSLCYWATDPFDNPDYDRFLAMFHETLGRCPPTLTALPLKDPARTRQLLRSTAIRGCIANQFSILTRSQLRRLHDEFTAAELLCVPLALQLPGALVPTADFPRLAPARKVNAGRARQPAAAGSRSGVEEESGSIACVIGFLLNLVERSVKLISPCQASDDWPLGYVVYDTALFENVIQLESVLADMVARHMPTEPSRTRKLRFRRGLDYQPGFGGFELSTRRHRVAFASAWSIPGLPHWLTLGELIRTGTRTLPEIEHFFADRHVAPEQTRARVQSLFDAGVLDEEPELPVSQPHGHGLDSIAPAVTAVASASLPDSAR